MGGADILRTIDSTSRDLVRDPQLLSKVKLQLESRNYTGLMNMTEYWHSPGSVLWTSAKKAIEKELKSGDMNIYDVRHLMTVFQMNPKYIQKELKAALHKQIDYAEFVLSVDVLGWRVKPYHKNILILAKDLGAETKGVQRLAAKYHRSLKKSGLNEEAEGIRVLFDLKILANKRN